TVPIAPFLFFENVSGGAPVAVQIDNTVQLDVVAEIEAPNGAVYTFADIARNTGQSPAISPTQAQYFGEFTPLVSGEYTVGLVGQIDDPRFNQAGQPFTPLDTRTANDRVSFTVSPVNVTIETEPLLVQRGGNWWEQEPIGLCVRLTDPLTGRRVPDMDGLHVEAELRTLATTSTVTSALLYQGDATNPCVFQGSITPPEPGQYELWMSGYVTDISGVEQEVFNRPTPESWIDAQPIRLIMIQVREPEDHESTHDERNTLPLWDKQALVLNIVTVDTDNLPVDLNALSGTTNDPPLNLKIFDADGNDVTDDLTLFPFTRSSYELRTKDLPPGEYHFEISGPPLEVRDCGCAYAINADGSSSGQVTRVIKRRFPALIYLEGLGAGLAALVLLGGIVIGGRYYVTRRKTPIIGSLSITEQSFNALTGVLDEPHENLINLTAYQRNTITLSQKKLGMPRRSPIKRITITNKGDEDWQARGRVRLTHHTGRRNKSSDKSIILTSNEEDRKRLYEDQNTDTQYFVQVEDLDAE
ncbi:MAG: hypothetical protein K8S97_03990, partial [Anaerolineae bacterium]|nr:hypothetical protein [Anaerolineae bacterium]